MTDIYERFDESDIFALQLACHERSTVWLERFATSLSELPRPLDPDFTLCEFWPSAWALIESDRDEVISAGLGLLSATSTVVQRRGRNYYYRQEVQCGEKQLRMLAGIWKARPSLRADVKRLSIEAGRAGHLRGILGLANWQEAEKKYPSHD